MKKKWIEQADKIGAEIKKMPGALVGCAVDNSEKADAFEKYWQEHHPHIEIIDRKPLLGSVFMRIRLRGKRQ